MDSTAYGKSILNISSPLAIIVLPYFLYLLFEAPNPPGPGSLSVDGFVVIGLLCGGVWFYCLIYILYRLGLVNIQRIL